MPGPTPCEILCCDFRAPYRRGRDRRWRLIATLFALCFGLCGFSVARAQYLWNDNPPDEPRSAQPDTDGVAASGAATYSVPIVVPQARGPVPNLALLYNSQSGKRGGGNGMEYIRNPRHRAHPR
jgi:hypothetical protein